MTDAKHAKELLEEQVLELRKALRQSRSNAPAAAVTALQAMEARAYFFHSYVVRWCS